MSFILLLALQLSAPFVTVERAMRARTWIDGPSGHSIISIMPVWLITTPISLTWQPDRRAIRPRDPKAALRRKRRNPLPRK